MMPRSMDDIQREIEIAKYDIRTTENDILDLEDEIASRKRALRRYEDQLAELLNEQDKIQPKLIK